MVKITSCRPKDQVYLVTVEALKMVRLSETRTILIDEDELTYAIPIAIEDQLSPVTLENFI